MKYIICTIYVYAAIVAHSAATIQAQDTGPYVLKTGSTSTGRQTFAGKNGQVNLAPGALPPFPLEGDIQAVTGSGLWVYISGAWRPLGWMTSGLYVQQGTSAGATVTALSFTGGMSVVTSGPTATVSPTYGVSPSTICEGNDIRLTNSRTPLPHATTHEFGGSDQLPIDLLAAPTDNTSLDATTSAHGLMKKLNGNAATVYSGAGTFVALPTGQVTVTVSGIGGAAATIALVPTEGVSATGAFAGSTETITLRRPPDVVSGGYVSRSSTNIMFAPYSSDALWCYESGEWTYRRIPDAGITTAATGLTASTLYYLYAYSSSGSLTLDMSTTGTTTQNGILVKSGAVSRTLVAYCYANASGAITTVNEDASTQLICNVFNKERISLVMQLTTASWTYNSTTVRAQNSNTAWRLQFVSDGRSSVEGLNYGNFDAPTTSRGLVGLCLDNTNAFSSQAYTFSAVAGSGNGTYCHYAGKPAIGYHFLQAVERLTTGSDVTTFHGTNGTNQQAGIFATVFQ